MKRRGGGGDKNVTLDSIRHLKSRQRLLGNICEMEAVWDLICKKTCFADFSATTQVWKPLLWQAQQPCTVGINYDADNNNF